MPRTYKMLSGGEKQLLARLKSDQYPEIAEDGKGFFVVWADGRAQVGYKNKRHAIAFIELDDRDAVSAIYREREKGETVRNIFSADKSADVHEFLFKEAEEKKEHRTKIAIHEVLFSDEEKIEKCLEEDERNEQDLIEKEAMAAGGFSNLKNSAANTSWRFTDLDVESAKINVARKAAPYFGNLRQNPASTDGDLRPNPLKLLFSYERTIRPSQDPEAARKSENAMNVLAAAMPKHQDGSDFLQFEKEIQRYQIPLAPFFMVSKFSNPNGDVDEGNLRNFIWREQKNQHSPSHYKEHVARIGRGDPIDKTNYVDQTQTFKMSEINTATRSMLEYAINDRVSPRNGYSLQIGTLDHTVSELLNKRLADNKIDSRNPNHTKNFKRYLKHYVMMMGRIGMWWNEQYPQLPVRMPEGADRTMPAAPNSLTGFELRLVLQHMVPLGSTPQTPPDEFRAPVKTVFLANGWDSSNGDLGTNMLTLPPLRQLPRGDVVYDRGNGNMGWNHLVFNWKKGLGQVVEKWGAQCDTWLKALQGSGAERSVQQSPEALDAMRNVTSPQSGNRTGAESLLDLLKKYPTWEEFEKNHIRKSLASEIRTVNKLYDNPIEFPGFRGGDLRPYVEQIKQVGATNPKTAHDMLTALSSQVIQAYKAEQIDWDTLTSLLHAINVPVAKMRMQYPKTIDDPDHVPVEGEAAPQVPEINPATGKPIQQRVSNGITLHPASRQRSMIDARGFESLKKYGYQVAKMMDFVSSIMYRSCEEIEYTPAGPVRQVGHKYGTSSGISKGGDIILAIRYNALQASASSDSSTHALRVDVHEDLGFSLGQKSGANDEPIILHDTSGIGWEQLVDLFNEEYPEAGYSNEIVNEPINRYLDSLQQKVKEALIETKGDIEVIYHDRDGVESLSVAVSVDEGMVVKEDAGEIDLVTEEPKQEVQPEEVQPDSEWSMGPEAFEPDPPAEEVEEQILPPQNQIPVQTPDAPIPPQQEEHKEQMPRPKPRTKPMSDPMTVPVNDPSARYIQKRDTKKRRLVRQQAGLGTIEERLQKSANKLDECGEFAVADKIDLLLQKIHEEKDVRQTSPV